MKYKWLTFLSQVACICNVCSVLMILMSHWFNALPIYHIIQSTIIILGLLAFFLNIVLQSILLVFRITKKEIPVPAWLRIFNIAAFGLQIVFYFIIRGV